MRVLLFGAIVWSILGFTVFEANRFYEVLNNASKERVEDLLGEYEKIEKPSSKDKVYTGALYIRMAGFASVPARRLEYFKKGRALLEAEIEKYPDNVEYRFVRLIMQEQVPAMLHYNKNLNEDKLMIMNRFAAIDSGLRREIERYAVRSSILTINQ